MRAILARKLKALGACKDAVDWVGEHDLATAWAKCERPDWMLWLCGKMAGNAGWAKKQQIVLLACDIAESVLPIFELKYPKDSRPRKAIEAARGWCEGKVSLKDVRAADAYDAASAADAAAAAASYAAAYAAASAAYDAASAAYDAADAAYAAYAASSAAAAYAAAAYRQSLTSKRKEIADLIRIRLTIGEL